MHGVHALLTECPQPGVAHVRVSKRTCCPIALQLRRARGGQWARAADQDLFESNSKSHQMSWKETTSRIHVKDALWFVFIARSQRSPCVRTKTVTTKRRTTSGTANPKSSWIRRSAPWPCRVATASGISSQSSCHGKFGDMHKAKVHVFSDSALCVGQGAIRTTKETWTICFDENLGAV